MGKVTLLMLSGVGFLIYLGTIGIINPGGIAGGLLMAVCLFGSCVSGFMWLIKIMGRMQYDSLSPKEDPIDEKIFLENNFEKIVDYIDQRASESVISNNNEWLKLNWHRLSDEEKIRWVSLRINFLKEELQTSHGKGSPAFILAMQGTDKKLSRGNNKAS